MANELQFQWGINYSLSGDTLTKSGNISHTVTNTPRLSGRQSIGTSEVTLSITPVSSVGQVWIQNLDATNYVTVGAVTGQRPVRIDPGKAAWFRPTANAIFIAANTAACEVVYEIFST